MSSARGPFQWGRAVIALLVAAVVAAVVVGALSLRDDDSDDSDDMSFALSGTGSGSLEIGKHPGGWRIELDTELPRLDGGQYYQAWLSDEAGTLVPIGTFNEGEDVVLWAGVSPLEFTTFSVTREKADGDQASSGDKVLTGTLVTEE